MGKRRPPPFRPFDPDAGPWLIWSHHWGCWHRRSETGGAAGYTNDIAEAGVFDAERARAYHDPPPYRRDEAIPAAKALKRAKERLAVLDAERASFAARVDQLAGRTALSSKEDGTGISAPTSSGEG